MTPAAASDDGCLLAGKAELVKRRSKVAFLAESFYFKARGIFFSPVARIRESGIYAGCRIVDFGCGIGTHSIAAAELVGETGRVYAVDCQPLAIECVKRSASKRGLNNVQTILTDCDTGLEGGTLDAVLLYDVFHDLEQPEKVLTELSRVLKRGSTLSFSDHHMKEAQIISALTGSGKFKLQRKGKFTYTFECAGNNK